MQNILIVDDEERIREILKQSLSESGFSVKGVDSAHQAFNVLFREPIDLIVLDINLPYVGGDRAFKAMQYDLFNSKILINSVYPIERQKEMVPDADGYHDKSEGTTKLLEKIREVLHV